MKTKQLSIDGVTYSIYVPDADTDYIQGKIAKEGEPYELEMLRDMASRVQPGDLVLDIGANIGNHTLYLASVAGCKVHAFEPNEHLCLALEQSVAVNKLDSLVTVHHVGVAEFAGFAHFDVINKENLGGQSLEVSSEKLDEVRLVALDDFTFKQHVKVIKIDVEGMELSVIKGALKLVRNNKPILYVEALSVDIFNELNSFLKELDYLYCNTFNATPTHLYVNKNDVSVTGIGDILFEKEQEMYSFKDNLKEINYRLLDSNRKYRDSTERYAVLKEQLENANKKYREINEEINKYKSTITEFEKNKQELTLSHRENIHEIENKISCKEIDFERERLKYLENEGRFQLEKQKIEMDLRLEKEKLKNQLVLEKEQLTNKSILDRQQFELKIDKMQEQLQDCNYKLKKLQQQKKQAIDALQANKEKLEKAIAEEKTAYEADKKQWQEKEKQLNAGLSKHEENIQQLNSQLTSLHLQQDRLEIQLQLQQQVAETLQNRKSAFKEKSQHLAGEVQLYTDKLNSANAKYRELTHKQIPILKEKLEQQNQRTLELYQRAEQLNTQLKQERETRWQVQYNLAAIKSSATFKAGLYVRLASRSFVDAFKLPVRLLRLRKMADSQVIEVIPQSIRLESDQLAQISLAPETRQKSDYDVTHLLNKANGELRIACIMDEFTYGSYKPEAQLCQLTPEHWQTELEACQPELLFIESAWRGKDELWGNKVGHCSSELQGIVAWCRERKIPTVFWNKEDPIHFETFLNTARLFDFVFTTDMDCIHRYKAALGHEHIYFLPFACQPTVHNPIEKYTRQDAFCFAGAYYVRYPERTRDLESFVAELPSFRPLEIYDRNYGKDHPDYKFPENYQPHIVGTLSFDEIDKAYKGYSYAINLNSIKQSQSMFARRVYELLGSNTLTVSNYSRGLRLIFGDLVLTSDSGSEVTRRLQELQQQGCIDRIRLAGLRKVMTEHTYAHRLKYVLEKVTGQIRPDLLPAVKVVSQVASVNELKSVLASAVRQQGVSLSLLLVIKPSFGKQAEKIVKSTLSADIDVQILTTKSINKQSVQALCGAENWIAALQPSDHYGVHYLLDMLLATCYTEAEVIGKAGWYSADENDSITLNNPDQSYQTSKNLSARRAIISPDIAAQTPAKQWLDELATWEYSQGEQFSVDCYNYCQDAVTFNTACTEVDDLPINTGIALEQLETIAETTEALASSNVQVPQLTGHEFGVLLQGEPFTWTTRALLQQAEDSKTISLTRNPAIQAVLTTHTLEITSTLPDGKHEYLYAKKDIPSNLLSDLLDLSATDSIPVHFETEPGLNLTLVVLYLDAKGNRLSHQMLLPNRNNFIEIPEDAESLRFGLRIYAGGAAVVKRVMLGHIDLEPTTLLGQSDVLLLTNHYPSYDDLYRNGFVHTRVKAYAEKGVSVDVFKLRKDEPIQWHEFQNIDVTTGSQTALRRMLASGRYRHVLVHFLDPTMWDVLKEFVDTIRVTVWVHGAEIHPWYRRKYNIETVEQEEKAKEQSELRMAFWQGLLQSMPANLHMVFVSKYFSEEVMEDLGFRLPVDQYSVIHNPIDTELFNYIEKDAEQRKKILSIRPFATKQYANDISVKCIVELSKKDFFNDLKFTIIGDGVLFEKTLEPLRKFANVQIEQRFVTQPEIAALHKTHGFFLCPSRWDSQGVSRDEAMSSGLIPLTTAIAAIPEFADESCAVLAPPEDHMLLADGIEQLYKQPDLFKKKTQKAAERVKEQTRKELVVKKELGLLF